MCSHIYAPFLPNFSLGVLNPHVPVCGFVLYTRRLESPTPKDLLRLNCGLNVGLDILTAIYFRKARDKLLLNLNAFSTFFFKQCTIFFSLPSLRVRTHWTDKICLPPPVQKSRQNLSLPHFQFGNRGRT